MRANWVGKSPISPKESYEHAQFFSMGIGKILNVWGKATKACITVTNIGRVKTLGWREGDRKGAAALEF